jgi:hypothetical protein
MKYLLCSALLATWLCSTSSYAQETSTFFSDFFSAPGPLSDDVACSAKYNKPIAVRNSYGAVSYLRVNTRSRICHLTGTLYDGVFISDGGSNSSSGSDSGCDGDAR